MKSFAYHAYTDTSSDGFNMCSRESDALPLLINCAGFMNIDVQFCTYNERGRDDFYLMYITGGNLKVGQDECEISAGNFIIFPPHYKYRYRFDGEGSISYYFVHFTGSFAGGILDQLGLTELPCIKSCDVACGASLKFGEIFAALSDGTKHRDLRLGAILQDLLVSLVSSTERSPRSERIIKSVEYLNTFYTEDISIESLAKMESVSVSRYNALFKEIMGKSPIEYVIELRMKHACTLLDTTDIAVGLIGEAVGYRDKYFFSKMFKKTCHCTPALFREKYKK